MKSALPCPNCWRSLGTAELLDAGTFSLPGEALLRVVCPHCSRESWAQLRDGHIAIGAPSEPADFRPTASAPAPDLSVKQEAGGMGCWFLGLYRLFPAGGAS